MNGVLSHGCPIGPVLYDSDEGELHVFPDAIFTVLAKIMHELI